jgi:hypothetical protein
MVSLPQQAFSGAGCLTVLEGVLVLLARQTFAAICCMQVDAAADITGCVVKQKLTLESSGWFMHRQQGIAT